MLYFVKCFFISGSIFFLLFLFTIIIIYIKSTIFDKKKIKKELKKLNDKSPAVYTNFTILNPYGYKGSYYKVQLHAHTNCSDGKLSPREVVLEYKKKGYNFLAITDHDKITRYQQEDDENFITITAEEMTASKPFWPLGEHIGCLFINKQPKKGNIKSRINQVLQNGGLTVINHPSCNYNLGTQQWFPGKIISLANLNLIEIVNHYSSTEENILYWHGLLKYFGPEKTIWGTAGDDSHSKSKIDKDFIMVKADKFTVRSLKKALLRGSFYISQGPLVNFNCQNKLISISSEQTMQIEFIDANLKTIYHTVNKKAEYRPQGNEGFIRVEVKDPLNKKRKAWSQPFWLIEN